MTDEGTERFTVWTSRIMGGVGMAVVVVAVLYGVSGIGDPYHPVVYAVCGLIGVVLWVMMLRPSVSVEDEGLVLRNGLNTVRIPLAAIEQVAVRQWLAVRLGDERRFTNPGVGRSRRQAFADERKGDEAELTDLSYGAFVERRIRKLAEEARDRQGVGLFSDEQEALAKAVRREPAWIEIGLLVVLVLAVAATAFL